MDPWELWWAIGKVHGTFMNKPWGSKLPTFTHQESTPDSSSLQALLASWKMLEGSPEHGYQNGSISKLADTPNMVIGCGEDCASWLGISMDLWYTPFLDKPISSIYWWSPRFWGLNPQLLRRWCLNPNFEWVNDVFFFFLKKYVKSKFSMVISGFSIKFVLVISQQSRVPRSPSFRAPAISADVLLEISCLKSTDPPDLGSLLGVANEWSGAFLRKSTWTLVDWFSWLDVPPQEKTWRQ